MLKLNPWQLAYAYARSLGKDREAAIIVADHCTNGLSHESNPDDKTIARLLCEMCLDFQVETMELWAPEELRDTWRN